MALVFGTTTPLPKQKYVFGSTEEKKETTTSLVSFFRIFIVIAEVGLSLLPGMQGTAATIGLGLAGATANTSLSLVEGTASGVGIGIDFAAAIVPGFNQARVARKIGKATSSILAREAEETFLESVGRTTAKRVANQTGAFNTKSYAKATYATIENQIGERKAAELMERIASGSATNEEKAAMDIADHYMNASEAELAASQYQERAAERFATTPEKVQETIDEWKDIFEKIRNMPRAQRVSRSKFFEEANKIAGKGREGVLNEIYLPAIKGRANTMLQFERLDSLAQISKASDRLSGDAKEAWDAFVREVNAKGWQMSETEMSGMVDEFLEGLKSFDLSQYEDLMKYSKASWHKAFKTFTKDAEPSALKRWVKRLGSKKFNDDWVQNLQLIDSNDAGRAIPERIYQKVKEKLDKYFERTSFKKGLDWSKKELKRAEDMEKAWVAAEGRLWPTGRKYIIGHRVLGGPPGAQMTLIKFNKLNTSAKSSLSKNRGGKKDILITCNEKDLLGFAERGSKYWQDHAVKKGWAMSKGGKKARTGFAVMTDEMSLFLGFVPIPALRNILSITSNWVENIHDIKKGDWTKEWLPKFERAFVRSTVNRSARLFTRAIVGGAVARSMRGGVSTAQARTTANILAQREARKTGLKYATKEYKEFVMTAVRKAGNKGKWIGRELQRLSTTVLSTFEGTNDKGYFKMTNGATKNSQGKVIRSGVQNVIKKIALTAAPTSVRGALTRHGARVGKTSGRQIIGNTRYMGQLGRIYSAATYAGQVKPLRSLTKIR